MELINIAQKSINWTIFIQLLRQHAVFELFLQSAICTPCYRKWLCGWGKFIRFAAKRWYNNKGLIVEGEKTNFGYDNDLLGTAAEVSKIIVPSKNAFSKYEQILELTRETIKTYDKKT
ncbi:DUF1792 domain-containing protein [Leuconostoc mesenteroides]|uniref:GT-D fold domain-containing glycosyltransferase n=2 Tax=Bacillati TaxID=1783272 RepID=UPI001CDF4997|nr:GT-D fold domain-containing glycosyltransferase [Leuconostoc mesenteroides]MBZ1541222.1 DUF1792 domain-containing protein [Leuconostoc mesenteroides]